MNARAHSVVVLPSLSLDADVLARVAGAHHYEERMLCMLLLLRLPSSWDPQDDAAARRVHARCHPACPGRPASAGPLLLALIMRAAPLCGRR